MGLREDALRMHEENRGKLRVQSKIPVKNAESLTLAYSPGVAEPCLEIEKNPEDVYRYTNKGNFVAIVSNGTAVLGLGNIGPKASLPVMEGKAVLFKEFGGVDGFPIVIDSTDPEKVIETVEMIAPTFGGINLEDIKAPECFYIENELQSRLEIPVFHDDQHGTAIIVLGGLTNALKLTGKKLNEIRVVVNGGGAAGLSITRLLLASGAENIIIVDRQGAIYAGAPFLNPVQAEIAKVTNQERLAGSLADVIKNADIFIGVSAANVLSREMVKSMAEKPVIFALANPVPEIHPEVAREAGAYIVATGRSDFPNQINNVLVFPGLFRGALDVQSREINEEMKCAAAKALASMVTEEELSPEYIIPRVFNPMVGPLVAAAVAHAAVQSGVARKPLTYEQALERAIQMMQE